MTRQERLEIEPVDGTCAFKGCAEHATDIVTLSGIRLATCAYHTGDVWRLLRYKQNAFYPR